MTKRSNRSIRSSPSRWYDFSRHAFTLLASSATFGLSVFVFAVHKEAEVRPVLRYAAGAIVCLASGWQVLSSLRGKGAAADRMLEIYRALFSSVGEHQNKEEGVRPSITTTAVAAFANERMRQRGFAITTLLASVALYLGVSTLLRQAILPAPIVVVAGAVFLLQVSDAAMEYRLVRGLYGTNEYEARQIIRFVLHHAEEIDLSGGLGDLEISFDDATERRLESHWRLVPS